MISPCLADLFGHYIGFRIYEFECFLEQSITTGVVSFAASNVFVPGIKDNLWHWSASRVIVVANVLSIKIIKKTQSLDLDGMTIQSLNPCNPKP